MICRQTLAVTPQYGLAQRQDDTRQTRDTAQHLTRLDGQPGGLARLEVTSMPTEPMPVVNQPVEAERYILVRNFDCERRR